MVVEIFQGYQCDFIDKIWFDQQISKQINLVVVKYMIVFFCEFVDCSLIVNELLVLRLNGY